MAIKQNEIPLSMDQKITITVRGEVFQVQVRGWRKGQYIMTDLPMISGESFRMAPQTGVQVHYTKEGWFVSFKSASILGFTQSISFLVIEYPRSFDLHNLRKHERFKANFPVSYFYEEAGKKYEGSGIIRDISAGGLLFSHAKELEKKNGIYTMIDIPNCGSIKNQKAEVRNLRKIPKSDHATFVTGIKWRDVLPETGDSISKFINLRAAERRNDDR